MSTKGRNNFIFASTPALQKGTVTPTLHDVIHDEGSMRSDRFYMISPTG